VTFKDHVLLIKDGLYVDGSKFLVLYITKQHTQSDNYVMRLRL